MGQLGTEPRSSRTRPVAKPTAVTRPERATNLVRLLVNVTGHHQDFSPLEGESVFALKPFKAMLRFEVFTAVTMKNVVFWDIKTQFVLHRRHITSPLQSPAT
jgi:hypothetical protein